jgi:hypothetical protein
VTATSARRGGTFQLSHLVHLNTRNNVSAEPVTLFPLSELYLPKSLQEDSAFHSKFRKHQLYKSYVYLNLSWLSLVPSCSCRNRLLPSSSHLRHDPALHSGLGGRRLRVQQGHRAGHFRRHPHVPRPAQHVRCELAQRHEFGVRGVARGGDHRAGNHDPSRGTDAPVRQ